MAAARFQSTLRGRLTLVAITAFDSNEASLARRGASLCQEPILRLPSPFNDADEVSCRAGAIKCSRCRASFAPIHTALADRIWFPRWNGHSPSIKRNKELEKPSDRVESQSSQSRLRKNLPVSKCPMKSQRQARWPT